MHFILYLVTTFLITSIQAGNKRVIIKVPQRTKHIYHHHVKKVPVYVIIPEKKPKILDALDEPKPTPSLPCREFHALDGARYRTTRSEKKRYQPNEWTEDRGNKGAYIIPPDIYQTLNSEFAPPPLEDIYDLPRRRVKTEIAQASEIPPLIMDPRRQQQQHEYRQSSSIESMVSFTYSPPYT